MVDASYGMPSPYLEEQKRKAVTQTLQELRKEIVAMEIDDDGLVSTWERGRNDTVYEVLEVIDKHLNELVQN